MKTIKTLRTMAMAVLLMAGEKALCQELTEIVIDRKAVEIVGKNTLSAETAEELYRLELDTIRQERLKLAPKVTLKNLVEQARMNQQTYLGDLGREKAAYAMLMRKCTQVTEGSVALLQEARKHPERMLYCTRTVIELVLQAEDAVEKCVRIAMGGKVANPLKDTDGEDRGDGYNLVYPEERLRIVYDTMHQLERINAAMTVLRYTLMTRYTWKDMLTNIDPVGVRMAMEINYRMNDLLHGGQKIHWW